MRNHDFRLRHLWPSALAFLAGMSAADNWYSRQPGTLIGAAVCLLICGWIVLDNIREESK